MLHSIRWAPSIGLRQEDDRVHLFSLVLVLENRKPVTCLVQAPSFVCLHIFSDVNLPTQARSQASLRWVASPLRLSRCFVDTTQWSQLRWRWCWEGDSGGGNDRGTGKAVMERLSGITSCMTCQSFAHVDRYMWCWDGSWVTSAFSSPCCSSAVE
jgi:hypothetical protein